jgi:hypothetical protein
VSALHGEAELSAEDLLQAALQLKGEDLDRFVSRLLALRAQQRAPSVPGAEAELLMRINEGPPRDLAGPYRHLIARRRAGTLTPEEHQQLLRLTDEVEAVQARRLEDLIELARLRQTTLDELMQELGIRPPLDG